jgi:hypothetical protein
MRLVQSQWQMLRTSDTNKGQAYLLNLRNRDSHDPTLWPECCENLIVAQWRLYGVFIKDRDRRLAFP